MGNNPVYYKKWIQARLDAGLCSRCGKNILFNAFTCLPCYEKQTDQSRKRLGYTKFYKKNAPKVKDASYMSGGTMQLPGEWGHPISKAETMHADIRYLIQTAYHEINHLVCPWGPSEGSMLKRMLKENPAWSMADWARMVRNYFDSHGVNGDRPRIWLSNISRYARGPLDQYGKVHEPLPDALVGKPLELRTDKNPRINQVFCATCGKHLGESNDPMESLEKFVCDTPKCREGWEI